MSIVVASGTVILWSWIWIPLQMGEKTKWKTAKNFFKIPKEFENFAKWQTIVTSVFNLINTSSS